jgi:predicted nucleic acid-binding Zn ribbon protein
MYNNPNMRGFIINEWKAESWQNNIRSWECPNCGRINDLMYEYEENEEWFNCDECNKAVLVDLTT